MTLHSARARRNHRYRNWIALLCGYVFLAGSVAVAHGHPLTSGPGDPQVELDSGCGVCAHTLSLRTGPPSSGVAWSRPLVLGSAFASDPGVLAQSAFALGHPSRAPPLG